MTTHVLLMIIGLAAGIAGGLLGIGGSIVMIPAMNELLGPDQHLYQSAAMIVNFFIVVPAAYQHRKVKAIDTAIVKRLLPLALVAVIIGVLISELPFLSGPGESYLRLLFGLFLIAISLTDFRRLLSHRRTARDELSNDTDMAGSPSPTRLDWRAAAMIAIPTGFLAGALGVGGGILAVPLQRRYLKIPIRNAIANSATMIIATSFVGAIVKNYAYLSEHDGELDSFILAAVLIPSAMIGSALGSRLVHWLPVRATRFLFLLALSILAIRLCYQSLSTIFESIRS